MELGTLSRADSPPHSVSDESRHSFYLDGRTVTVFISNVLLLIMKLYDTVNLTRRSSKENKVSFCAALFSLPCLPSCSSLDARAAGHIHCADRARVLQCHRPQALEALSVNPSHRRRL